jgi:hypothetical protein
MNAVRRETGAELLQRVTSGDLSATPFVDELPDTHAQLLSRRCALGFQPLESRSVDRFERQPELKARR